MTEHLHKREITLPAKLSFTALVICAFCIPVSLAVQNIGFVFICLIGLILAWSQFKEKTNFVKKNALSLMIFIYFLWVCIGAFYTNADPAWLHKMFLEQLYLLGFFPILFCLSSVRQQAFKKIMLSYVLSCLFVFLIAVVGDFGWLPNTNWFNHPGPYYAFFKIYGALFMAFGGFIALNLMLDSSDKKGKWFYGISFLLITYNVFWMSFSRSGYVIYAFLLLLSIFQLKNKKLRLIAIVSFTVLALLLALTSVNFKTGIHRINQGVSKFSHHDPRTSTGIRMAYVKNSIKLWKEKPIFGYGMGGFLKPYAKMKGINANGDVSTMAFPQTNPENTYMYVLVEHGLIGIVLLLLLYFAMIRKSFKLNNAMQRYIAQGFIVLIVLFSLAGNLLMGNSPMIFFVFFSAVLFVDYKKEK